MHTPEPLGPNLQANTPNHGIKSRRNLSHKIADQVFKNDPNKTNLNSDVFDSSNQQLVASYEELKRAKQSHDKKAIKIAEDVFAANYIIEDLKDGVIDGSPFKDKAQFGSLSQITNKMNKTEISRIIAQADILDDGIRNGSVLKNNPGLSQYIDANDNQTPNYSSQSYSNYTPQQGNDSLTNPGDFSLTNPLGGLANLSGSASDLFGVNEVSSMMTDLIRTSASLGTDELYQYNDPGIAGSSGKFNQAANLGFTPGGGKLVTVKSASGATFNVNEKVAKQFQGFVNELEAMGYKINPNTSGGYNYRNIAGSSRLSQHAYGTAIDINSNNNALGTGRGNLPPNIREIAAKYGLAWGGDFKSNNDPMHFEVAKLMPNIDTNGAVA